MRTTFLILLFCVTAVVSRAGSWPADTLRIKQLEERIALLLERDSSFNIEIDVVASKLPLSEVLRNVAKVNHVNLCVRDADQQLVSCNFRQIRVSELLLFLCREYKLDMEIVGNIVSVFPYLPEAGPEPEPAMEYESSSRLFSCDFTQIPLIRVARKMSGMTGINIIVPQQLYNTPVSGYIHQMPAEEAIRTLGNVNQLTVYPDGNECWRFMGKEEGTTTTPAYTYRSVFTSNQLETDSTGRITANITSGNLADIISGICEKLKLNYYFVTPINRNASIFVENADLTTFLNVLFTGSEYSWYENGGIYLFSSTGKENNTFVTTRIVPLRYRTVEKIPDIIPEPLKKGIHTTVFPDLNSVILCGEQRGVSRIEDFLRSVDKSVPLITIDVMIVDVRKNSSREAGITMGVGDAPEKTKGKLSPGINMNFNASSINKLINSFNGFGSINLGKVAPDFYLNLKLLEQAGNIELRSTPKLSTLNGHEAKLKSGETRHYKEVTTNIYGSQNPMQSDSYVWKSIDANLELTITPFVSSDSTLTLTINIIQTEFADDQIDEKKETPPSTATRSFESILRVKNGEMVLLGGIEKSSKNDSSSGIPFLARIPVLKWLFGSSVRSRSSQKLNVFIQPTIIF